MAGGGLSLHKAGSITVSTTDEETKTRGGEAAAPRPSTSQERKPDANTGCGLKPELFPPEAGPEWNHWAGRRAQWDQG